MHVLSRFDETAMRAGGVLVEGEVRAGVVAPPPALVDADAEDVIGRRLYAARPFIPVLHTPIAGIVFDRPRSDVDVVHGRDQPAGVVPPLQGGHSHLRRFVLRGMGVCDRDVF